MTVELDVLMTFAEVAEITRLQVGTLRKYVLRETIPFVKLGGAVRFDPGEIKQWLEENSHRPAKIGRSGQLGLAEVAK